MVALLKMPGRFTSGSSESIDSINWSERRNFVRKDVQCRVQGRRLDHSVTAHRSPFMALATRDLSYGGCSAISDHALDVGERVSIFFPPSGAQRGWDAFGRVLRCNESPAGYRVAVEFDPLPAA